jgi:hypothetical protein
MFKVAVPSLLGFAFCRLATSTPKTAIVDLSYGSFRQSIFERLAQIPTAA